MRPIILTTLLCLCSPAFAADNVFRLLPNHQGAPGTTVAPERDVQFKLVAADGYRKLDLPGGAIMSNAYPSYGAIEAVYLRGGATCEPGGCGAPGQSAPVAAAPSNPRYPFRGPLRRVFRRYRGCR